MLSSVSKGSSCARTYATGTGGSWGEGLRIRRRTAALIRDLAMQGEQFRAEMDEHPRLIVPGEDSARPFRALKTPGQDA